MDGLPPTLTVGDEPHLTAESPVQGKVALVTGAGSTIGLGHAMALALVRAGARVAMMDINKEALDESADEARELGGRDAVLALMGDVSSPADAARAVKETLAGLGGLHVLVNNAGTNPRRAGLGTGSEAHFGEVSADAWARVMAVNLNGPFFMAQAAVGHLLSQGWGRIIGVTTSLDTMIRPGGSPYGPSKAGHEAFIAVMA